MKLRFLFVLVLTLFGCVPEQPKLVEPLGNLTHPRLRTVQSRAFLGGRPMWVYLPPGYEASTARYPVIYLMDGEAMFSDREPSLHVDRMADELIRSGRMPPVILVGLTSAGPDRLYEYSPWPDSSFYDHTGGGDEFLREVTVILKPFIDRAFRTRTESANTGLAGISVGGLMAIYGGYTFSGTFGRVMSFSGSYWWNRYQLLGYAGSMGRGQLRRVYHDTGALDDNSVVGLQALADTLQAQGFVPDVDLLTVVDPLGNHDVVSWRRRFPAALEFITRDWPVEPSVAVHVGEGTGLLRAGN